MNVIKVFFLKWRYGHIHAHHMILTSEPSATSTSHQHLALLNIIKGDCQTTNNDDIIPRSEDDIN